ETCRKCHVLWKDHMNKTCEQVMEEDEIRIRVAFEEKMTAARVRKCHRCGTGLVKSEGCNRMSCRCGAFMCYLCPSPKATTTSASTPHPRRRLPPLQEVLPVVRPTHGVPPRSGGARCCQDDERIIRNKRKHVGPPPEPTQPKVPCLAAPVDRPQGEPAPAPHGLQPLLLVPPQMMLPHLHHQPLHVRPIPAPYVPPPRDPAMNLNAPINLNPLINLNPPPPMNEDFNIPMHFGPALNFYRPR
ncbi:hypothetical protein JZ751_017202, partial [Albula glossodonta]